MCLYLSKDEVAPVGILKKLFTCEEWVLGSEVVKRWFFEGSGFDAQPRVANPLGGGGGRARLPCKR